MGQTKEKEAAGEIFLSLVIPVFNEEESLPHLWGQIECALANAEWAWEAIFVDDGSTDASFAVLGELAKQHPQVCALRFRRNYRKAAALAAGFKQARGQVIVTLDADLQDDPSEIPRLLAELNRDYDLVSGWKAKRRDPLSKTLPSRLFNRITSLVSGVRLRDFNCGLKAYRREVAEDALPYLYGELYRFLPAVAHWMGYRVGEIPVQHHPRRFGHSKFGAKRLLNGFLDLLTVTFVVRFMTMPMHVFGSLGLGSTLCGSVVCAYVALLRYEHGNIQNRYPLLMLGILLIIVGIQCFSIGFLGDMIASMHQRGGRTPRIAERLNG